MEQVRKIADHIHTPMNRFEIFNRLSQLPHSKQKMRQALKERMRQLAAAYVSLATFIDDDEVEFVFNNKKSKRSRAIALRVSNAIDRATRQMEQFKVIEKVKKISRKDKENLKKRSDPPLTP